MKRDSTKGLQQAPTKNREQQFRVETEAALEAIPWCHQFSSPQKISVVMLHVTELDYENDKAVCVSGAYRQCTNEYKGR